MSKFYNYKGTDVEISFDKYMDGHSIAITLVNQVNGKDNIFLVATYNLGKPLNKLISNNCIVVNTREHNGIDKWLIDNNIVKETLKKSINFNFYEYPVLELTKESLEEANKNKIKDIVAFNYNNTKLKQIISEIDAGKFVHVCTLSEPVSMEYGIKLLDHYGKRLYAIEVELGLSKEFAYRLK